ncbi:hypothetical protein Tco_0131327, partial [Tanacetum coccineum]
GKRRAADKYRFSSREVQTEVDKEQIRQVQSTESHKYGDEREQIRQVQSTESHKYGDGREQNTQIATDKVTDSDSRQNNRFGQQIQIQANRTIQTNEAKPDNIRCRTRRNETNQTDAKPDVTNITKEPEPFNIVTTTNSTRCKYKIPMPQN